MNPANEQVVKLIARLEDCRREKRCKLLFCPKCGPRRQSSEGYKALDKVRSRLGDWPTPESISWVMIGGPRVQLETIDIAKQWNSFRKKLYNVRDRSLKGIALHGYVDVSLGGRIHFHGWIVHPDLARVQLRSILKKHFPESSDIYVERFNDHQPIATSLDRTILYSLERRPRLPRASTGLQDSQLPRLMGLRLLAFHLIVRRGYVGCRVSLGLRSTEARWKRHLPPSAVRGASKRRPRTDWFWKNVLSKRDSAKGPKRPA